MGWGQRWGHRPGCYPTGCETFRHRMGGGMEQGFGGLNRSPMVASAPWAAFGGSAGARPCSWALPWIPEEGAASLACVALSALPGERPTVLFPAPARIPPLPLPQCGWLPSAGCLRRCSLPGHTEPRSAAAAAPPTAPALDKPLQAARYRSSAPWGGGHSRPVTEAGRVPSHPGTKDRFDAQFRAELMKTFFSPL